MACDMTINQRDGKTLQEYIAVSSRSETCCCFFNDWIYFFTKAHSLVWPVYILITQVNDECASCDWSVLPNNLNVLKVHLLVFFSFFLKLSTKSHGAPQCEFSHLYVTSVFISIFKHGFDKWWRGKLLCSRMVDFSEKGYEMQMKAPEKAAQWTSS